MRGVVHLLKTSQYCIAVRLKGEWGVANEMHRKVKTCHANWTPSGILKNFFERLIKKLLKIINNNLLLQILFSSEVVSDAIFTSLFKT